MSLFVWIQRNRLNSLCLIHILIIAHCNLFFFFFFFNDTATTEIYTLSLHDALPIYVRWRALHLELYVDTTDFTLGNARCIDGNFPRALSVQQFAFRQFPLEENTLCLLLIQQRSEEHTSELQSLTNLVCRLLLEKKKK